MKKPSLLILGLIALAALVVPTIFIARNKEIGKNPLLLKLWRTLWGGSLSPGETVVKVKGWRTALIDSNGTRRNSVLIPEWAFWDPMWKHYTPKNPFWKKVNNLRHRLP